MAVCVRLDDNHECRDRRKQIFERVNVGAQPLAVDLDPRQHTQKIIRF